MKLYPKFESSYAYNGSNSTTAQLMDTHGACILSHTHPNALQVRVCMINYGMHFIFGHVLCCYEI